MHLWLINKLNRCVAFVQLDTILILFRLQTAVPRARGVASNQDIEVFERERGNDEFKKGNFIEAVKCYTKCLGLKVGKCACGEVINSL